MNGAEAPAPVFKRRAGSQTSKEIRTERQGGMLRGKVLPSSLVRHGRNGREACFGGKSGGSRRGLPDGMAGPFCPFF
ncbi:hypothetical protein B4135_3492 [Caldibacillus debilis]|uniref:Uncharacterized protein n=1 Tax=Caldibacillus debilis TaxID=301148 RepID=A0A150LDB0_9BACI|nr:hypothetical protein B4135_3492 [Caldibacillus debilis]